MGIMIVTGSRYLGFSVGDRAVKDSWMADNVQGWAGSVKTLSGVSYKHP